MSIRYRSVYRRRRRPLTSKQEKLKYEYQISHQWLTAVQYGIAEILKHADDAEDLKIINQLIAEKLNPAQRDCDYNDKKFQDSFKGRKGKAK